MAPAGAIFFVDKHVRKRLASTGQRVDK